MFFLKSHYLTLALVAVLSACGGGGGGGSSGGGSTPPTVGTFQEIKAASDFSWATTAPMTGAKLTLQRTSGAALGKLQVWVSNYTDTDPLNPTIALTEPMRTSLIQSVWLSPGASTSTQLDLSTLTLPSTTTAVLIEVFDPENVSGALLAKKVTLASLKTGLTLQF